MDAEAREGGVMQVWIAVANKWPEILGGLIAGAIKWFSIGALLHLGWRVAS